MNADVVAIVLAAVGGALVVVLIGGAYLLGRRSAEPRRRSRHGGRREGEHGSPGADSETTPIVVTPVDRLAAGLGDEELAFLREDNDHVVAPPPMVGDYTLKEWLIHVSPVDGVWKDVVTAFYTEAERDPLIEPYFRDTDMERLQNHFLKALLVLTDKGLTVGMARMMATVHRPALTREGTPITPEVYDAAVTVLGGVLKRSGVSDEAIGQTVEVVKPLRALLAHRQF